MIPETYRKRRSRAPSARFFRPLRPRRGLLGALGRGPGSGRHREHAARRPAPRTSSGSPGPRRVPGPGWGPARAPRPATAGAIQAVFSLAESEVGKVPPQVSPTLFGTQRQARRPWLRTGSGSPFQGGSGSRRPAPPGIPGVRIPGLIQIPPGEDARPRTPASVRLLIAERENAERRDRRKKYSQLNLSLMERAYNCN